jgi:ParB-like chromosome segregation protein Spo0J
MHVELRDIETIKPYAHNPRDNDHAVEAVAASIREFGFRQPIVVDETGTIIAGHTRDKAARKLGLKQVPVHVATDLTPAQIKAYRLADNKTAEHADWDHDGIFSGCCSRALATRPPPRDLLNHSGPLSDARARTLRSRR